MDSLKILRPDMKLEDIFKQYPQLKSYLIQKSDKFKILNSPLYAMIKNSATIKMVTEKTGISLESLQIEFDKYLDTLK